MPTQAKKFIKVTTPLGSDKLLINSFAGTEQLSRLFQFDLELSSEDPEIKFEDIIGQKSAVRLDLADDSKRWFHGIVSRFVQTHTDGRHSSYRATLVPWLWLLTRASDCRIFQHLTIPQIIQEVFEGHGFGGDDFELRLSGTYQAWDYCVQYRETDFNFVSRLMEQEGIYYFFEHEEDRHKLVLADSQSAHSAFAAYDTIRYHPPSKESEMREETVTDWLIEKEVQTGVYALKDFNFKKPAQPLTGNSPITREHEKADFEVFDYPGEYEEPSEAESYAKLRIEELQAQYEVLRGQASSRGVMAGAKFTLSEHPRGDQNREYLVTSTSIRMSGGDYESGGSGEGNFFSCGFTAIPFETPYRAARVTPKPIVQGPQTAIVVGPSGDEIYTDSDGHGRVKVQFHWDRHGEANENSSCWVRVSQAAAGRGWGAINIPRIGQEVIVEFLEGDPDWPIITGRVYNAAEKTPYPLPEHKTKSTFKSNSSTGGQGFNEFRFEDKKGEEQVFMHGEKNLDIRIKNDALEFIGNDRHLVIKHDQLEHVTNDRHEIVDHDHKEKIGNDRHLKIVAKEAKEVGGQLSLTVKGDVVEVFKAKHSEETTGDYYLKAENIVIEGNTNVTIKVGGSSIAIEAGGIALKTDGTIKIECSATMDLKSDAPLTIESSATADMKSPSTTVKGDGMLTLKGGVVMIN